jgi:AraC-like DNA-binding protein
MLAEIQRPSLSKAKVVAMLEPALRARLDAGAQGLFCVVHVLGVPEALQAIRERPARALLVSPRILDRATASAVSRLVTRCPGLRVVAVTDRSELASAGLLDLGACGIRDLVDLSTREGWNKLRTLVADNSNEVAIRILERLTPLLSEATSGAQYFFGVLVRLAPSISTARELARGLGAHPSTMMSRFFRVRLPSPKRYLATTRLLYAAAFFEHPSVAIADVAYRLAYSSPQSFGRHVRTTLGMTAGKLRREYSFTMVVEHFTARLISPYRGTFQRFDPLGPSEVPVGLSQMLDADRAASESVRRVAEVGRTTS